MLFLPLQYFRRTKTSSGKGNTKSLKWFSSTLEDLADANGNISAEKFKDQMRQPQVHNIVVAVQF
jgi:hypothetical protein